MKNFKLFALVLLLCIIGSSISAQTIRVRGTAVSIWNVNGNTPSLNQMIYPLPLGIRFESRREYSTLGERHFWVDRNSAISNKDYATNPRVQDSNVKNASLDAISASGRTKIIIAVPIRNMNVPGWKRVPYGFDTSLDYMYTYEYDYRTPNQWIDVPYNDKNQPTIIFADKGKMVFDNPISISTQSEGVIVEDKNMPYNRKDSSRGVRAFYSFDPNLLVLPNGNYIAGRNGAQFISKDKGKSWTRLASSPSIDHASVFSHKGDLYIIGDEKGSNNHGTLIARSTNEGRSWSNVVSLGFIGRNSPSPVVTGRGRLWVALEDKPSANVIMASASENSNLLDPRSWLVTKRPDNPRDYKNDDNEPYIAQGRNGYPIAFSINEGPVQATSATSAREIIKNSDFDLPSKGSKSDIKYDPVTDKYWALTSASTVEGTRSGITLFSSTDLRKWTREREVIQATAPDFHGFNYAFMQFDGDDIVFASRTAYENKWGLPTRWHDSNMLTFHRISNFRGDSSTTCSIVPHININNEGWNSTKIVEVEEGDEIWFGPQSRRYGADGGDWSWTGPNGSTHSGREWRITNIRSNQAGTYTVTNTDQSGCRTTETFTVAMEGTCAITPYININREGWNNVGTATVEPGDQVWFGPQSVQFGADGGNWSYSGPNGQRHTGRSWVINNIQSNQSGTYTATNTDQNGCRTTFRYTITVKSSSLEGQYHIRNVKTGEYLDSDSDGVTGQVRNPNGADKRWNVRTSTPGYYFIDNAMSSRGPLSANPNVGRPITYLNESYNERAYHNREWEAIRVSGNTYRFLCKDKSRGYITAQGKDAVISSTNGNDTATHWELIPQNGKRTDQTFENLSITIAPVPNNGAFDIQFNGNIIANVSIYNITGQKVFNKSFNSDDITETLSINQDFISGIYMVKSTDIEGNQTVQKMIVQQ